MKKIEKVFMAIAAVILVPTVLLVAFILIADATDMDLSALTHRSVTGNEPVAEREENSTGETAEPESFVPQEGAEQDAVTEQEAPEPQETGKINAEKYERIQNGMSYQELVTLIGEEGTMTAESDNQGSKTKMYEWTSENGWGTAIVVLQDDRVINKSQTGAAAGAETVPITLEQYNRIEEGMTYDKVVEIIGGDGEAVSEGSLEEAATAVYIWKGTDEVSNATITFYNNAVFSKAQTGLK